MNTPNLVFIAVMTDIAEDEHYTMIVDHYANFQNCIVSHPNGRDTSRPELYSVSIVDIHAAIEEAIFQCVAAGERYLVIAHGMTTGVNHDRLMIEGQAEDLGWRLDNIRIVLCSVTTTLAYFEPVTFNDYFQGVPRH